ncbi:putative plasma membrane iron permease protein [Phaeoacremonium minimum UCRPA7]|uniref:Putative plasma membrane iron permease protein n=1 Tax=Phaeoacremonium minimum (strain UCR-PA7) TaxID=1286976 RepID=R8BS54_PHAM7|nr:putative plasma membrane iron permease protein [Phaeoacremonium minimum UCRPA7]EOO02197.1 putative plasma membrane iron permease protein [Phaeoacremonium minimum UCRPA7]
MVNVFAVQVFFIVFRECLEAIVVLSVLFSFLKQCLDTPDQDPAIYKRLRRHVWIGAFSGVGICLIIGGAFIGVFYGLGRDIWSQSEDLWEGIFYLIATVIITVMGLALLRINKMQDKWRQKIAEALAAHAKRSKTKHRDRFGVWIGDWSRRHVMFILPFITTLREGIEAIVFVGGVSLGLPAKSFPLPVICGILAALLIGYLLYRGGNAMSIQIFLIASTSVLYLIAAGMFSKAVWYLQYHGFAQKVGSDVAEVGSGDGSYNIRQTVYHVNCCNPETDNGWDVFNAILGWQNTGTYGSIISYNVYWLFLILCIFALLFEERTGHLPFSKQAHKVLIHIPGYKSYKKRANTAVVDPAVVLQEVRAQGVLATE